MNNKVQNPIDILAGLVVIFAGILIITSYVNLGLLLVGLGALIEAIKIVLIQSAK